MLLCSQAEAKDIGERIFDWLDVEERGWLDVTDFYNVFPSEEVHDAFDLFDKGSGKVVKDDMVTGVQAVRFPPFVFLSYFFFFFFPHSRLSL